MLAPISEWIGDIRATQPIASPIKCCQSKDEIGAYLLVDSPPLLNTCTRSEARTMYGPRCLGVVHTRLTYQKMLNIPNQKYSSEVPCQPALSLLQLPCFGSMVTTTACISQRSRPVVAKALGILNGLSNPGNKFRCNPVFVRAKSNRCESKC